MTPQGITVHNTANDASAMAEISYMLGNDYETSFHYAVDDYRAVQGIEENRNGWHASDGNGFGNRNTIAIEICYSKSGGSRFDKAEENAVELIVNILKRYGWGIDKVKRHYDYAPNKKYCPHRTMDKGWQRFLNMIQAKLKGSSTQPTTNNQVNVFYQVETKEDGVLPMVKNLTDYAGWKNHPIRYLAMKVDAGSIKYRITTVSGKVLSWVTQCNIKDHKNGCAGNGEAIATVEVYYYTPDSIRPYKKAKYKVNDYAWQFDLEKTNGQDGYAGVKGVAATKFRICID
jgi:N-acetylmuramoyl-L-alanine amidase CwlA